MSDGQPDLVDYLRDKLKPHCTCDRADACDLRRFGGHESPHRTVQGRTDPDCPFHGNRAEGE